jgi:NADPH:quinone reductase-like Zn-dependent oxidoreductase
MRTAENLADREAEKECFKISRAFAKRVKGILGDAPNNVFEDVGQATFPTSVFVCKPFGKVVICGATAGFQLDFDVRYLWMRQKRIIGSHGATLLVRAEVSLSDAGGGEDRYRGRLGNLLSVVTVPNGHNVLWEAPAETFAAVERFLGP